jgi:hypothetical protein
MWDFVLVIYGMEVLIRKGRQKVEGWVSRWSVDLC